MSSRGIELAVQIAVREIKVAWKSFEIMWKIQFEKLIRRRWSLEKFIFRRRGWRRFGGR